MNKWSVTAALAATVLIALFTSRPDGGQSGSFLSPAELLQLEAQVAEQRNARNVLLIHYFKTNQMDDAAKMLGKYGSKEEIYTFLVNWIPSSVECIPKATAAAAYRLDAASPRTSEEKTLEKESRDSMMNRVCSTDVENRASNWVALLGI